MRVFLTLVAAVVVVIVLVGLVPFRNDEAAAEALDACYTQTEGMPLTANEKEIFVYRCMSSWHFSYLTKCGDSHATQCYRPPGFLAKKWFEIVDCVSFQDARFDANVKGCVGKALKNAKIAAERFRS